MFREYVTARKMEYITNEITLKTLIYNLFIGMIGMSQGGGQAGGDEDGERRHHRIFLQQST